MFGALVATLAVGCNHAEHALQPQPSLGMLRRSGSFGVVVDARTGSALAAVRFNQPIRAAVADGHGGWFIGGGFIRANGALRKRLAHIDSNGRLDRAWRPEANGNGVSVTSLALIGSRLYVAGDFGFINHHRHFHLAALAARTGRLDEAWRPPENRPFWNNVLLAAGRRLIAGGGGGSEGASAVVALDPKTGRLDPTWRANVDASNLEGGGVYTLEQTGPRLFVGGTFSSVDGVTRSGLAALDSKTGALDRSWRLPKVTTEACFSCSTLFAVAAGSRLIYASVNGPARYQLVALDTRTGRMDPRWRTRLSLTSSIYVGSSGLALARAGSRVYVAGDFDGVSGSKRHGFAALDATDAHVLPSWNPRANTVSGSVLAKSGSRLLVGVQLSHDVGFDFAGLTTFRPVRRLRLLLALSGSGSVRIGIGRGCAYNPWSTSGRCNGKVFRWIGTVRFVAAGRRRFTHSLRDLPSGRYFLRFVPQAQGGPPQPAGDLPFRVGPPTPKRPRGA